jgi:hypothetical protein
LLGVANAVVEGHEGLAVVEIRGMNDVSGSSQLAGESEESFGLSLCVVKEQDLGHTSFLTHREKLASLRESLRRTGLASGFGI